MMNNRVLKKILVREFFIFLIVTFVGYMLFADGSKTFRYPMSARPEVKERFLVMGRFIMYFGYFLLAIIRFAVGRIRQAHQKAPLSSHP